MTNEPRERFSLFHERITLLLTVKDRIAMSRFTFEMAYPKHLDHVLRAVRGVPGVFDVYRVTG